MLQSCKNKVNVVSSYRAQAAAASASYFLAGEKALGLAFYQSQRTMFSTSRNNLVT
jgi:hypothetical protein